MLQIASFSVAKDIQSRAHADAARVRRSVVAAPDDSVGQGKRWIDRFRAAMPLRRGSIGRLGA